MADQMAFTLETSTFLVGRCQSPRERTATWPYSGRPCSTWTSTSDSRVKSTTQGESACDEHSVPSQEALFTASGAAVVYNCRRFERG